MEFMTKMITSQVFLGGYRRKIINTEATYPDLFVE